MNSFTLEFDDALAGNLLLRAAEQGISLSQLVSQLLSGIVTGGAEYAAAKGKPAMSLEVALDLALEKVRKLPVKRQFMLEELFSETEWENVPSHRVFGRLFKQRLDAVVPTIATFQSKNGANKAVYVRR